MELVVPSSCERNALFAATYSKNLANGLHPRKSLTPPDSSESPEISLWEDMWGEWQCGGRMKLGLTFFGGVIEYV